MEALAIVVDGLFGPQPPDQREGFVEPRTTVTDTTLILIAHDGEWTRRRIPDPRAGRDFGQRLGIPIYNVQLTGYPQRMRDYNERRKRATKTEDA